jgi:hypothetical protein
MERPSASVQPGQDAHPALASATDLTRPRAGLTEGDAARVAAASERAASRLAGSTGAAPGGLRECLQGTLVALFAPRADQRGAETLAAQQRVLPGTITPSYSASTLCLYFAV